MSIRKGLIATLALLAFGVLSGCATQRPVVYPSGQVRAGDPGAVQADIDACIQLAQSSGVDNTRGQQVAENTAVNAAVGGGTGAVVGVIAGNAGQGAAIGAAGAGVATLLREAFKGSEPSGVYKSFVAECLRERGHKVIGWQ